MSSSAVKILDSSGRPCFQCLFEGCFYLLLIGPRILNSICCHVLLPLIVSQFSCWVKQVSCGCDETYEKVSLLYNCYLEIQIIIVNLYHVEFWYQPMSLCYFFFYFRSDGFILMLQLWLMQSRINWSFFVSSECVWWKTVNTLTHCFFLIRQLFLYFNKILVSWIGTILVFRLETIPIWNSNVWAGDGIEVGECLT